jgi:hypothetical protein
MWLQVARLNVCPFRSSWTFREASVECGDELYDLTSMLDGCTCNGRDIPMYKARGWMWRQPLGQKGRPEKRREEEEEEQKGRREEGRTGCSFLFAFLVFCCLFAFVVVFSKVKRGRGEEGEARKNGRREEGKRKEGKTACWLALLLLLLLLLLAGWSARHHQIFHGEERATMVRGGSGGSGGRMRLHRMRPFEGARGR